MFLTKFVKYEGLSDSGFVVVQGTTYWTDLFVRHFLFQTDRSTDADDLLFFIRKKHVKGSRYIPKYQVRHIFVSRISLITVINLSYYYITHN